MIRVELLKMLRRPRTWVTIVLLNVLPTLVAVLLAVTDIGPQPGQGPAFLSAVLTDGTLFPLLRWRSCCRSSCPSPSRWSPATQSPARRRAARCATC